jgi:hypothetical protein
MATMAELHNLIRMVNIDSIGGEGDLRASAAQCLVYCAAISAQLFPLLIIHQLHEVSIAAMP